MKTCRKCKRQIVNTAAPDIEMCTRSTVLGPRSGKDVCDFIALARSAELADVRAMLRAEAGAWPPWSDGYVALCRLENKLFGAPKRKPAKKRAGGAR